MCWRSSRRSVDRVATRRVVRLVDGESGLSARTIKRRLASVSGLFNYLVFVRRDVGEPGAAGSVDATRGGRGPSGAVDPRAAHAAEGAGSGSRSTRCWVRFGGGGTGRWSKRWCWAVCAAARSSGCGLEDLRPRSGRVFIADGKGGHQRLVPISARFFRSRGASICRRRAAGRGDDGPGVRGVERTARRAAVG